MKIDEMKQLFEELEDRIITFSNDDDYKEHHAYFKIGDIENMVDYCRQLLFKNEELKNNFHEINSEYENLRYYLLELIPLLNKWDTETIKNYLKNCLIPIKSKNEK